MKGRTSPAAQRDEGSPRDEAVSLWPFEALIALAAVPIVWLLLAAIFWMTNRWLGWPTVASAGGLGYLAVAIGLQLAESPEPHGFAFRRPPELRLRWAGEPVSK